MRLKQKETIRLSYKGFLLDENIQICYYPLIHKTQDVHLDIEIICYVGVLFYFMFLLVER